MRKTLTWVAVAVCGALGTGAASIVIAAVWFLVRGEPMMGKDPLGLIIFALLAYFFLKWARDAWLAVHPGKSEPAPN